jgi:hypothetical protein
MALVRNRPLPPLGMLHVGTKLGIVYGISMLVSLILQQRTICSISFWLLSLMDYVLFGLVKWSGNW